ncbi:MAG: toxin [Rhodospirillales bacterium]|nr:toxin [Rhodospirillales bacterium]
MTGTGSMTVPIATSPGRANFGPQLSLSYDSGAGNGPFGFGWTLGLPAITRKTDKGLPRYRDTEESDVFILSGAEDLVPELKADGQRFADQASVPGFTVHRYRPRIEAAFARIERWTRRSDGDVHWRALSRDNVLTLYGRDANSRIADPADPRRVFSWLISETRDDRGNAVLYDYKPEDGAGVDLTQSHEHNRGGRDDPRRSANRHLKRIRYGNRTPLLDAEGRRPHFLSPATMQDATWLFEAVFDYGEHDAGTPTPGDAGIWPCRNDPFSSYRAGFELRTYRLCRRVLMFHHFPGEAGVGADCLVRSTDFTYRDDNAVASFLTSVSLTSWRRDATGYLRKSLPPVVFGYSQAAVGAQVHDVEGDSIENLPDGTAGATHQWVDLDGEGLTGVLAEQGGGWFYKRNVSALTHDVSTKAPSARLAPLEPIARLPVDSMEVSNRRQFLDLAGDGQLDLVTLAPPVAGFHERDDERGWTAFHAFDSLPNVAWTDPNLRFVDLTGDGHADILLTEDHAFLWHASLAEAGFGPSQTIGAPSDEEHGPRVVFADGTETIFLADMSGDGLTDIVRVRNGEVCYWPNLGYGRFGAKVAMDGAPWFDPPDQFDPRRLRLADIDGSGVTDIIYLGRGRARFWFNQSGNGWSGARDLAAFPAVDNVAAVAVVDLLGNGTACLVWSSSLKASGGSPMKYLPLMAEGKPHLLTSTRNNLGAETRVHYAPSTYFYLKDRREGRPWITRLPFPVHVVARVETLDRISRNRFVTRYAYHHGHFDGAEREFRGFGMVEQFDTEEFAALSASDAFPDAVNIDAASHVPPVLTRTWFHTGAFIDGDRIERLFARGYFKDEDVPPLPDTLLPTALKHRDGSEQPWRLTTEEVRQACRALKGAVLRQEIYARDGSAVQALPYSVTESNYTIELLQPSGPNRHAAFFTHAREAVTLHYERKLYDVAGVKRTDPRIMHAATLATDGYGNVLQMATISYGRRFQADDPLLSVEDRRKQRTTLVIQNDNAYTVAVDTADDYRAPLPADTRAYEILKLEADATRRLFDLEALRAQLRQSADGSHDLPYEDVEAAGAVEQQPYRRLIEHTRLLYRRDDLGAALPIGQLESHGLPFESYRKAFTPGLVDSIFVESGKLATVELATVLSAEAGYVQLDGDAGWWVPSGRVFFHPEPDASAAEELAAARAHFSMPRSFRDPFHHDTRVRYDGYDLLSLETEDALHNKVTAGERDAAGNVAARIDYRVLQPTLVTDVNGNRTAIATDVFGLVVGTAVMGKTTESLGDSLATFVAELGQPEIDAFFADPIGLAPALLGSATTRVVYDIDRYYRTGDVGQPICSGGIARERHDGDLPSDAASPVQVSMGYSDGFGREIQRMLQAEPGPVEDGGPVAGQRWVVSGWTVFNNKGMPVRAYEPFFSAAHRFAFGHLAGVSAIVFYDPLGRSTAVLHANHTYEKIRFDPWRRETWDLNDTVTLEPLGDPDVAPYLQRLPATAHTPTWFQLRSDPAFASQAQQRWPDPVQRSAEAAAAQQSAEHSGTPAVAHFDPLGRAFVMVDDNGSSGQCIGRLEIDIEDNHRAVVDALGRIVMRYDHDMLGRRVRQVSMEAGTRWVLNNIAAQPVRGWDSRQFMRRVTYDPLRRPADFFVTQGGVERLAERTVYGESLGEAGNHRMRIHQVLDGAGVVTNVGYDFKGNLLESRRQLLADYKGPVDWQQDAALGGETFTISTSYDALNRPLSITSPDGSVYRPTFNNANLLNNVDVTVTGSPIVAAFISNIDYNAKGQRERIHYGNGAHTAYTYDEHTFRLLRLRTERPAGSTDFTSILFRDPAIVQDVRYTWDPAGNVTSIRDAAQQTVTHDNQSIEPVCKYVYDALYRLIEATGREHIAQQSFQSSPPDNNYRNHPFSLVGASPNDLQALRNYTERYEYDPVGNFQRMIHQAKNGNWTRQYEYQEESGIEPGRSNNRLSRTTIGQTSEIYDYDEHGNLLGMPHVSRLAWDVEDQLERAELGGGGTAYYVYDASGSRARKVIELRSGGRKERIYLNGFELYREYGGAGDVIDKERRTLHVTDGSQRIALIDMQTIGDDGLPPVLPRYQLVNHLGSASLELDEAGRVISYEEYHPYGTTSCQVARSGVEVSSKRYRYTGKERDEETGLYYHGARYYAPWLGRWTSCDPSGIDDGVNLFEYVGGSPCTHDDPNGSKRRQPTKEEVAANNRRQKPLTPEQLADLVNQAKPHKPRIKGTGVGGMGGSPGKGSAANPAKQSKRESSSDSSAKPTGSKSPSSTGSSSGGQSDPSATGSSSSPASPSSSTPSGGSSAASPPASSTGSSDSSGGPSTKPGEEMSTFEKISHELTGIAAILNLAPPEDQPNGKKFGSPLGANPNAPNDPRWQFGFAIAGLVAAIGAELAAVGKALWSGAKSVYAGARAWTLGKSAMNRAESGVFTVVNNGGTLAQIFERETGAKVAVGRNLAEAIEYTGKDGKTRTIIVVEGRAFFKSSSGTSGKTAGAWYEFYGIREDGWIVKQLREDPFLYRNRSLDGTEVMAPPDSLTGPQVNQWLQDHGVNLRLE